MADVCDHKFMVKGPTVHTLAVLFCASKALFSLILDQRKKKKCFSPKAFTLQVSGMFTVSLVWNFSVVHFLQKCPPLLLLPVQCHH